MDEQAPRPREWLKPGRAPARRWWVVPRFALALMVCSLNGLACAATIELTVEGVEGAPRANILSQVELATVRDRQDLSETYIRWLAQQVPQQVRRALEPFGYYRAAVESRVTDAGDRFEVRITVAPGEATTLSTVEVGITGPGADDPELADAVSRFPLAPNDVLDHRRYEEGKARIADVLRERGYFTASETTAAIRLDPSLATAAVALEWDSGPRHRFGEVEIQGGPVAEDVIRAQMPFRPGEPFDQGALDRYYSRLVETGYFATVSVVPRPGRGEDLSVPVSVLLQAQPRNVYEAGVTWSTDTGPGVDVSAERRWFSERGDRVRADISTSTRRKFASLRYHRPGTRAPVLGYDGTLTYVDEETDSRRSQTYELAASQTRELGDWRFVAGAAYRQEDFVAGEGEGESELLVLSGDLARVDLTGVYPRDGYSLRFTVRGSADALASDTDFLQAEARAVRILPLAEQDRLILRGHIGATLVDTITDLPPGYRFYAGGDRSIRGYDFEALGPVNDAGEVIGGRYLAVATLEYEKRIVGPWGMAVFVDAGNAFDDDFDTAVGSSGSSDIAYGVGLGLRWISPIGPLRLDLAAAPREPGTPVRLHFGLGPAL